MKEYKVLLTDLKKQQIELNTLLNTINETIKDITGFIDGKMYRISNRWMKDIDHPEWLTFSRIWKDKWVSNDYSDELIVEEIKGIVKKINQELALIDTLTQSNEDAIHNYKMTLDFERTMKEYNKTR